MTQNEESLLEDQLLQRQAFTEQFPPGKEERQRKLRWIHSRSKTSKSEINLAKEQNLMLVIDYDGELSVRRFPDTPKGRKEKTEHIKKLRKRLKRGNKPIEYDAEGGI